MGYKKWVFSSYDIAYSKELASECEADPIVALIASSRGISDPMDLEQFLSDEPVFSDFYLMADIRKAADIVNEAIENKEKITIFGDYDCDGVSATALMYNYLKSRGAVVNYYIPNRFLEGYGMNIEAVEKLSGEGTNLILTVDNGIVCFDEIEKAKQLGMKTVVTDHHLALDVLPNADAVVNPHRKDCPSTFKEICGTQVAFRLICVMEDKEPEELLYDFADVLSLAVCADIMPLVLENRSILKAGIDKIKNAPLTGISALVNVAGVNRDEMDASKIAFTITPRINAAGRMGDAARAVELLTTDNMMKALNIASEIDTENSKRQQIEKNIFDEAVAIIEKEKLMYNRVIVVANKGWHHGVVGIVASRICEKYGVPAILLSIDDDIASGSGRSIEGFSLYDAIDSARELTIKFGGHEQAAGVTVMTEDIEAFNDKINDYAATLPFVAPEIKLDCKLKPEALTIDLCFALEVLEPFGAGNPRPLFAILGVTLLRATPMGNNKHLRLLFSKGQNSFQCVLFGTSLENFPYSEGDVLDIAVNVSAQYYKGVYSPSIQVKAIRVSGIDDNELFADIFSLNDFLIGRNINAKRLLPTREEVGNVYKTISKRELSLERIRNIFIKDLGYAKTTISLKVLCELGLIEQTMKKTFRVAAVTNKTALDNSKTFSLLTERSGLDD